MGITLTGDFAELARWAARLKSARRVMPLVAGQLSEEMRNLTIEGFDKSSDPYGRKWAPRKGPGTGRALLVRTGAMRGSVTTQHGSSFASVKVGQAYSVFHQSGTSRMVQRMIVPDGDLPPEWRSRMDDVAADALEEFLG